MASEPYVISHAQPRHGFIFSMFYYMKGGHFAEILNHLYERTLFKFPQFSDLILEFLAIKPFDNKVRAKRVVCKIEIELNIPHYIFKYRKRYHVENENPPVNFWQTVQRESDSLSFVKARPKFTFNSVELSFGLAMLQIKRRLKSCLKSCGLI
jgi:hypothetical protein